MFPYAAAQWRAVPSRLLLSSINGSVDIVIGGGGGGGGDGG